MAQRPWRSRRRRLTEFRFGEQGRMRPIDPQRRAGVAALALRHVGGRADADDLAAGIAAFGAEIDDPIGGADHIEIVFDDDDRVAALDELVERVQQRGDIVEVQARGRLVEKKQRALVGDRLACGED